MIKRLAAYEVGTPFATAGNNSDKKLAAPTEYKRAPLPKLSANDLATMRPFQLRAALRERQLSQGGIRDDLVERLRAWTPREQEWADGIDVNQHGASSTKVNSKAKEEIGRLWLAFARAGLCDGRRVSTGTENAAATVFEAFAQLQRCADTLAAEDADPYNTDNIPRKASGHSRHGLGAVGPEPYLNLRTAVIQCASAGPPPSARSAFDSLDALLGDCAWGDMT